MSELPGIKQKSILEGSNQIEQTSLVTILWINIIVFSLNVLYFGRLEDYKELYLFVMTLSLLVAVGIVLKKASIPSKFWFYVIFTSVFVNLQYVSLPSKAVGSDLIVTLASLILIYYMARIETTPSKNGIYYAFALTYGSIFLQQAQSVEIVANRFEKTVEFLLVLILLQVSFIVIISVKQPRVNLFEVILPVALSSILLRPLIPRTEITMLPASSALLWIATFFMIIVLFVYHKLRPKVISEEAIPPSIAGMLLLPEITRYSLGGKLDSISPVILIQIPNSFQKIAGAVELSLESILFFTGSLFLIAYYLLHKKEKILAKATLNSLIILNLAYLLIETILLEGDQVSIVPVLLLIQVVAIAVLGILEEETSIVVSIFLAVFSLSTTFLDVHQVLSYLAPSLVILFGITMTALSKRAPTRAADFAMHFYFPGLLSVLAFSTIEGLPKATINETIVIAILIVYIVISWFLIPKQAIGFHSLLLTATLIPFSIKEAIFVESFSDYSFVSSVQNIDLRLVILGAYVFHHLAITVLQFRQETILKAFLGIFSPLTVTVFSQGFLLLFYASGLSAFDVSLPFGLLFLALFATSTSSLFQMEKIERISANSLLLVVLFFAPRTFGEPVEVVGNVFISIVAVGVLFYSMVNIYLTAQKAPTSSILFETGIFVPLAVITQVINSYIVGDNGVPDVLSLFLVLLFVFWMLQRQELLALKQVIQYQAIIFGALLFYNKSLENSVLRLLEIPYDQALQWFFSLSYIGLLSGWYFLARKLKMKDEVVQSITLMNLATTIIMLTTRAIFVDILILTLTILLLWHAFVEKTQPFSEILLSINLLLILIIPVTPGILLLNEGVSLYLLLPIATAFIIAFGRKTEQKKHFADVLIGTYTTYYLIAVFLDLSQPFISLELFGLLTLFTPIVLLERYHEIDVKARAIYYLTPFSFFLLASRPTNLVKFSHLEFTFDHWITGEITYTSVFLLFLAYEFVTAITLYFSKDEMVNLIEAIRLQFLGLFIFILDIAFNGNLSWSPDLAILLVLITTLGTYRQFAKPRHRLLIVLEMTTLILSLVWFSQSALMSILAVLMVTVWFSVRMYWWYMRGDDSTLLFMHAILPIGIGVLALSVFVDNSPFFDLVVFTFLIAVQFGLTGIMVSKRRSFEQISNALYGSFVACQVVAREILWFVYLVLSNGFLQNDIMTFLLDIIFFVPLLLHTRFYLRTKFRYLDQPNLAPDKNPEVPILAYVVGLVVISAIFGLGGVGILKLLLVVLVLWTFEATIRTKLLAGVAVTLTIIIPHIVILELFGVGLFNNYMSFYTVFLLLLGFAMILAAMLNEEKYYGEPLTFSLAVGGLLIGFIAGIFTVIANYQMSLPMFPAGTVSYLSGIIWSVLAIYSFKAGIRYRKIYLRRGSIAILSISVIKALFDLQGLASAIPQAFLSFIITGTLSIIMLYWISQKH